MVKKVDQEIISEKLQDWGQVLLSPRRMSARAGGCFPCFLIEEIGKRRINQINMFCAGYSLTQLYCIRIVEMYMNTSPETPQFFYCYYGSEMEKVVACL